MSKVKVSGYEFREGARFQSGAVQDPSMVGKHLEALRKQAKGELTPEEVVDDARGHNSPLHSFFEWDETKAAQQHRLAQARGLIRSVVAVYTSATEPAKRMAAFVHIDAGRDTAHYRATDHALSQKDTREQVLRRAWSEFVGWRRRYADLAEFAGVFAAADKVEPKLPKAAS